MRKYGFFFLCLGLIMFFWQGPQEALSSPGGHKETPNSDRGLKLFEAYCVGCHGLSGRGDGPMAAPLLRDFGVRPSDLTSDYIKGRSDDEIKMAVTGGGRAVHRTAYMPAWGSTLKENQVNDLLAYVREIQTGGVMEQPGFPEVGEELELGRVLYSIHCMACHGSRGEGDGPFILGMTTGDAGIKGLKPPNLAAYRFFRERSDADLEELISQGSHHSGLEPADSNWWQRQMKAQEMEALIFYLRTLPLNRKGAKG